MPTQSDWSPKPYIQLSLRTKGAFIFSGNVSLDLRNKGLKKEIKSGVDIISALVSIGNFLSSKGEARRAIRENSVSVNKNKVDENYSLTEKDLIDNRYILMQKGKKNYYIAEVT